MLSTVFDRLAFLPWKLDLLLLSCLISFCYLIAFISSVAPKLSDSSSSLEIDCYISTNFSRASLLYLKSSALSAVLKRFFESNSWFVEYYFYNERALGGSTFSSLKVLALLRASKASSSSSYRFFSWYSFSFSSYFINIVFKYDLLLSQHMMAHNSSHTVTCRPSSSLLNIWSISIPACSSVRLCYFLFLVPRFDIYFNTSYDSN